MEDSRIPVTPMDDSKAEPLIPPPPLEDAPPTYGEATDPTPSNFDTALLQPMSFLLSRQTIFSSPVNPSSHSQPPAPAYTLDRAPASLTHSTSTVDFSRVETVIAPNPLAKNQVRTRPRQIYNLRRWEDHPMVTTPLDGPRFFIESTTKHARVKRAAIVGGPAKTGAKGLLGKGKDKFLGGSERADLRCVGCNKEARTVKELRIKIDEQEQFEVFKRPNGGWAWKMDVGGGEWEEVALEEPSIAQDGRLEPKLIMVRPLARDVLDALVALWCCRVWAAAADDHRDGLYGSRSDEIRRRLRFGGQVYGGSGPMGSGKAFFAGQGFHGGSKPY